MVETKSKHSILEQFLIKETHSLFGLLGELSSRAMTPRAEQLWGAMLRPPNKEASHVKQHCKKT